MPLGFSYIITYMGNCYDYCHTTVNIVLAIHFVPQLDVYGLTTVYYSLPIYDCVFMLKSSFVSAGFL